MFASQQDGKMVSRFSLMHTLGVFKKSFPIEFVGTCLYIFGKTPLAELDMCT